VAVSDEGDRVTSDDKPIPRWQKIGAGIIVAAAALCIALWHSRLGADFVPLDASRIGPNLIASLIQWAVLFIVAVLVWPPTRQRIGAELDRIHGKLDRQAEHNEWMARHIARIHKQTTGDAADPHPHFEL
jgi:hypothetical protein